MSTLRVLLVGYYGKGNFGDDVLLAVTHAIVRQHVPHAQISVLVDGDVGSYVKRMLPDVTLLPSGRHGHFDQIIHGGGGVFFDFKRHPWHRRWMEYTIRLLGFPVFVALEKRARWLVGKPRTSAQRRLGMGIGVGTYTTGSPRLRASLPILADFDALWVRDGQSIHNLRRFASVMDAPIIEGSDLAFLTQHWMAKTPSLRESAARPRLGIILRDWAEDQGGTNSQNLRDMLAQLASEYDLTGFILDQHEDPQWREMLLPYRCCIWQPEHMSIQEFSEQLAMQDVLLTSRAHGAICGACLGIPSVVVAIEPKLQQVAAMLPHSCLVVAPDSIELWPDAIRHAQSIPRDVIAADVERNRASSQAALQAMTEWLR